MNTWLAMSRLSELFIDLQRNKRHYLGSSKGTDFEDRINSKLHALGYSRLTKSDIGGDGFVLLRESVLDKETENIPGNPFSSKFNKHFFYQAYGPQNYPDFLILDDYMVVSVEVKFRRESGGKPMWNSGLPRPNGIYVFGSYGRGDITFFRGCDVVSIKEAKRLHDFFDKGLKEYQRRFNSDEMCRQAYGFSVYIRKAFDQNKAHNPQATLDFFNNARREELENAVIQHLPR